MRRAAHNCAYQESFGFVLITTLIMVGQRVEKLYTISVEGQIVAFPSYETQKLNNDSY